MCAMQWQKKIFFLIKTKRWPMCLFYGLLNGVGINSWVIYKCLKTNNKPHIKYRRTFLKKMGMNLIEAFGRTLSNAHFEEGYQRKYICDPQ